jgi:thymidine kinase
VSGTLTVFTGPMFSGKTEGLINSLVTLKSNGLQVVALKPLIDKRYSESDLLSHSKKLFPAEAIATEEPQDLSYLISDYDMVGIDEVQFFGAWIIDEIKTLLCNDVDVTVSGLDLTFKGEPFGVMPHLLCLADDVHKLMSTCSKCQGLANRSHRTSSSGDAVLVGGAESYEPRCLDCFENG